MPKKIAASKNAIDVVIVQTLTAGLQGLATEEHLHTLVSRMTGHYGAPVYSEFESDNRRPKLAGTYAMYQWPHTRSKYLTVLYNTHMDGLSLFIGDDEGDTDDPYLWNLPTTQPKKKKVKANVLTPDRYNAEVADLALADKKPESQVLYLRDLLSKMLGEHDTADGDSCGNSSFGWTSGNAELVLSQNADGLIMKIKDLGT